MYSPTEAPTKLSVLGGSSPFTAALVDALVSEAHRLPKCTLYLHGRDVRNLESMARYSANHLEPLGWSVNSTTTLTEALAGAYIVIHQIRYGGLDGRAEDENIAARFGVAADETLGLGALHSILRSLPELRCTSREIAAFAPDAWILNLTNPLSAATSIMLECGVQQCIGLCELPGYTANEAAFALELSPAEVSWEYIGLNHRGFVVSMKHDDKEILPELPRRLNGNTIEGIAADQIAELGALPTKYFQVISGRKLPGAGRAAYLLGLRDQVASELALDPANTPPSLRKRYLEWYSLSVVPMIVALYSAKTSRQTVNVRTLTGLVEEVHAKVCRDSFEVLSPAPVYSAAVQRWMSIYRTHEEAVLRCIEEPGTTSIAAALLADPVSAAGDVQSMAEAIWRRCKHPLEGRAYL